MQTATNAPATQTATTGPTRLAGGGLAGAMVFIIVGGGGGATGARRVLLVEDPVNRCAISSAD